MPSVHTPRSFRGDGADILVGPLFRGSFARLGTPDSLIFFCECPREALEKLSRAEKSWEVRLLPSSLWVTSPWPQRCMCPKHRTPNCWLLASPGLQRRDPRQWSRWRDHSDAPRVRWPVPPCAGRSLARFVLHSGKLRHRYGRPMTLHHDLEGEGMDNGTGHYRLDSDAAVDDVAVMSRSDQSAGRAYMEWRSISARWTRSGSVPKTATAEVRRTPLLRPKAISTRTTQLYQTKRSDALVSMPEGNF